MIRQPAGDDCYLNFRRGLISCAYHSGGAYIVEYAGLKGTASGAVVEIYGGGTMSERGLSYFGGRVWRGWFLAGWLAAGMLAGARAEDRYVLPGSLVKTWDTFAHRSDPTFQTFPDNCSQMAGVTRLTNGNVACLFSQGISEPGPRGLVLYVFAIDPTQTPAWKIVDGPRLLDFQMPDWYFGGLCGGIAEYTNDRYLLMGYGAFKIDGDEEHFQPKTFLLSLDKSGGQPVTRFQFSTNYTEQLAGVGEIAYLPGDGQEPESLVVAGAGNYHVFNLGGSLLRTITAESLGLAHRVDQCRQYGSLEASDNGDLFAVDYDQSILNDCPDWRRVMCARFNRYGQLKGVWGLGASIADAPPENGFASIAQLANGDFYCSALQALYLIGSDTPETGNAHTYRHFIIRPPYAMSQPVLYVSPTNVDFARKPVSHTYTSTVLLSNPGSAPLRIDSATLSGDTNAFHLAALKTKTLEPGYGELKAAQAWTDCAVAFTAAKPGPYHAQLTLVSGDPANPTQAVNFAAFAVPARYSETVLLDTTNVWPAPNHPTGMALSADGRHLLLMLAVWGTDQLMRGRVAQVPLVRDAQGRITGLEVAAVTNLCELSQASSHALRQGGDGTLWYGPRNSGSPYLFQRTPAGTVFTHSLSNSALGGPVDLQFLPGQGSLVIAQSGAYSLQRYDLVVSGGVTTPVYKGSFGFSAPAYIRAFDFWLEGASVFALIYQANGELWLMQAPAGAFEDASGARIDSALVANAFDIQALAHDPISGEVLVLDDAGKIQRLAGCLDFLRVVTLQNIAVAAGKIAFTWEAEAGKTYRLQTKAKLSESAWQDAGEIKAVGAVAEFSAALSDRGERYFRVLLVE